MTAPSLPPLDTLAALADALRAMGLEPVEVKDGQLMVRLDGTWRRGLPVLCTLEERHLRVSAMLAGAVEEQHAQVYGYLLQRNERAGDIRFALDGEGDVLLVGRVARGQLDSALLDELLGELLTTADETFNHVLGTGFAGYVGAEQRWRSGAGMPDNPAFPQADA